MLLPPLREELTLHPGPTQRDGAPSWTLRDPVRNRFFRIDWATFEVLARWHLGAPDKVVAALRGSTALDVETEDVQSVLHFLWHNDLMRIASPAATQRLTARAAAEQAGWGLWLIQHYLFFRVPLIHPDRLLQRWLKLVGWAYGRAFLRATLAAAPLGLLLVLREWQEFVDSVLDTFTLAGLLTYGVTLSLVKLLHELAHACTAKRLGCRVPSMGIALLVMWPVLYTDVNESWLLPRRRDRLAIGAAGLLAELAVAAWAMLAWGFLPPGALREAACMLATVTIVSSLVVNASPFMRFDGYFLLMDLLDIPNLHQRSFAMARWWLREALFALGEPCPEPFGRAARAALIGFAIGVWLYRLGVFLGIAVLVYHFFFKVLGVALFMVEIGCFVAMPLWREFGEWLARRRAILASPRTLLPAGLLLGGAILACLPWQTRVAAPALAQAGETLGIYLPVPARLTAIATADDASVAQGGVLFTFASDDLAAKIAQNRARIDTLDYEMQATAFAPEMRERLGVIRNELVGARATATALAEQKARLTIIAPTAGRIVDVLPALHVGDWVAPQERLAILRNEAVNAVDAYVSEVDLPRIAMGAAAEFQPETAGFPAVPCWVAMIDPHAARVLVAGELASTHGGAIDVRGKDGSLIPEHAIYRVRLAFAAAAPITQKLRGTVMIAADGQALGASLFRSVMTVLVREWGT
jgi:putative peptide zinc metalloprotease protein